MQAAVGGQHLEDRAWTYPNLYGSAVERVGEDVANDVAFWREVEVVAS